MSLEHGSVVDSTCCASEIGFYTLVHVANQTLRNVSLLPLTNILVHPPEIFRTGSPFLNTMRKWVCLKIRHHRIRWCIIIFPFTKCCFGVSHPHRHPTVTSWRLKNTKYPSEPIQRQSQGHPEPCQPALFPAVLHDTSTAKIAAKVEFCSCEPFKIPLSYFTVLVG